MCFNISVTQGLCGGLYARSSSVTLYRHQLTQTLSSPEPSARRDARSDHESGRRQTQVSRSSAGISFLDYLLELLHQTRLTSGEVVLDPSTLFTPNGLELGYGQPPSLSNWQAYRGTQQGKLSSAMIDATVVTVDFVCKALMVDI